MGSSVDILSTDIRNMDVDGKREGVKVAGNPISCNQNARIDTCIQRVVAHYIDGCKFWTSKRNCLLRVHVLVGLFVNYLCIYHQTLWNLSFTLRSLQAHIHSHTSIHVP